jgi:hypothetical protein
MDKSQEIMLRGILALMPSKEIKASLDNPTPYMSEDNLRIHREVLESRGEHDLLKEDHRIKSFHKYWKNSKTVKYLVTHITGGETGLYDECETREEAEQSANEARREGASSVEIEPVPAYWSASNG